MRILRLCLALIGLGMAAAAAADVRVNDPTGNPVGSVQNGPSVCKAYSGSGGNQLVVTWFNATYGAGTTTASYAVSHLQPLSFVQHGTLPAPTGWHWWADVSARAPQWDVMEDGTFYVAGQVQADNSPRDVGLGFVRGHAEDPAHVTFDPPQLLQNFGLPVTFVYTGLVALGVHPESGVVYVLCAPALPGVAEPRGLYLWRTFDSGATWEAPVLVSPDSTRGAFDPHLAFGLAANEVTVTWRQTAANPLFADVVSRSSSDGGSSFGLLETAMTVPHIFQNTPAGYSARANTDASVVNRWDPAHLGEMVIGTSIGMNTTADPYPDPAVGPSQVEIEGNGSVGVATPFLPLTNVLRGTASSAPADTDWFTCPVYLGMPVSILCDSLAGTAHSALYIAVIGPNGTDVLAETHVLTDSMATTSGRIGFTPVVDGVYWLRIAAVLGTASYRLRVAEGTTPYPSASDQHDVALSLHEPFGSWTGALPQSPVVVTGCDESEVALASAADGALYCSFTDFSVVPGEAISRRAIRRSTDGGATWSAPVALSSANTSWMPVKANGSEPTTRGSDMTCDGTNLVTVWADGRLGDPDIYLDYTSRTITLVDPTPFTLTAHPGQSVTVSRVVRNDDPHEPFDVRLAPDASGYGWSLAATNATLAAGQTASLSATFTIPPTATAGSYVFPVVLRSAISLVPYTSATLQLTITTPLDVEADAPKALAFAPVAPNPIVGRANFAYTLTREGPVTLELIGVDGRRVRTLVSGTQAAGAHAIAWDGRGADGSRVGPGAYFAVLRAEDRRLVQRCVVVR